MNKKDLIVGITIGITGLGAGFATGYLVAKHKYRALLEEEINYVKDISTDPSRKEGIFATPEGAAQVLIGNDDGLDAGRRRVEELLRDNSYKVDETQELEWARQALALDNEERIEDTYTGDAIVNSIWENSAAIVNPDAIDQTETMPDRELDKPYIITVEEFMTDGIHEQNKVSLLFFELDGQLVDERETIIPNIDEIVGDKNLTNFGLGSQDRNVVYIRNEKLESDFEVIRDARSFSEVVLGVKPERTNNNVRKMRDDDE